MANGRSTTISTQIRQASNDHGKTAEMGKRAYRQTLEDVGDEAQNDIETATVLGLSQLSEMATSLKGAASRIVQVFYRWQKPLRTMHGQFWQNVAFICFQRRF